MRTDPWGSHAALQTSIRQLIRNTGRALFAESVFVAQSVLYKSRHGQQPSDARTYSALQASNQKLHQAGLEAELGVSVASVALGAPVRLICSGLRIAKLQATSRAFKFLAPSAWVDRAG